jgi:hypothetical protein
MFVACFSVRLTTNSQVSLAGISISTLTAGGTMTLLKSVTASLVLAVGIVCGSTSALAREQEDLLASTTAQWWQYINSVPPAVSPLLDPSGVFCMVGQRDPMWFLTGAFFGGTATRTCTVAAGEALFFPVINYVNFNTPYICGQGGPMDAAELRAPAAAYIDGATNLSVKVDGKAVKDLMRIKSDVFAITLPADNIWNSGCGGPGSVPAGVYSPSIDDGYYVLLKPLSVGNHMLHIHAEVPSQKFLLDVTYDLVVVPVQVK